MWYCKTCPPIVENMVGLKNSVNTLDELVSRIPEKNIKLTSFEWVPLKQD